MKLIIFLLISISTSFAFANNLDGAYYLAPTIVDDDYSTPEVLFDINGSSLTSYMVFNNQTIKETIALKKSNGEVTIPVGEPTTKWYECGGELIQFDNSEDSINKLVKTKDGLILVFGDPEGGQVAFKNAEVATKKRIKSLVQCKKINEPYEEL